MTFSYYLDKALVARELPLLTHNKFNTLGRISYYTTVSVCYLYFTKDVPKMKNNLSFIQLLWSRTMRPLHGPAQDTPVGCHILQPGNRMLRACVILPVSWAVRPARALSSSSHHEHPSPKPPHPKARQRESRGWWLLTKTESLAAASRNPPNPEPMPPSPPTPAAPKTIADFFARPAKRLRAAPAASLSSNSSPSSLSPEQRRRADTNLALARARRNLRLAESKAQGTPLPRVPSVRAAAFPSARTYLRTLLWLR